MPAATICFDLGDTLVFNTAAGVSTRFDDTLDALQLLRERGYRIGVLSNQAAGTTPAQVRTRLANLGLARWIDATLVTISTEIAGNVGKPAQPIFDLALAKAGHAAASASSIFVTEEAAHVAAARGFGWRAIVVKRGGVCGVGDGECVRSLTGLLALLPPLAGWGSTNLQLAPPTRVVDGLWAVPVDVSRINARLTFNAATQTAQGDATVEFTLGRHAGCPVFDLRQTPTGAWLDGAAVPLADVAAHDFGGGALAEMRVLARVLDAGSNHTLRLTYDLGLPQASTAGSYQPQIAWSAGPRLAFNFGFTDLGPGRYLEAFIPANMVFDQFELILELQLSGTGVAHQPITNGSLVALGSNHWRITFPPRSTALSPLLELRAVDTLLSATHGEALPVSGGTVLVTAWKLASNTVDVTALAAAIGGHLAANENSSGSYHHGGRFTAFVHQGGMEYDGGTTSSPGSLRHEAFHSWWGRGLKPASQVDGWFDEAWTVYHDNGASAVLPLNFANPPVELSSRNPWVRTTPSASYSAGERFWKGIAAMVGAASLVDRMNTFYRTRSARPVNTEELESHLLASTGRAEVVDAFHRFVYGLPDPTPVPDLWLRDDLGHGGEEQRPDRFWDSPDLWVRNQDDGGLTHQNPEFGQDNWLHARVHNRSANATARHLMVSFNVKQFAGSQFAYPTDWLPAVTAAAAFDLGPGETRIVKARWPCAAVPPAGTHPCLLAAVFTRFDAPVSGKAVWEQNNLAQKNLTVVDLRPNLWFVLPFVAASLKPRIARVVTIELVRPSKWADLEATLVVPESALVPATRLLAQPLDGALDEADAPAPTDTLDCGYAVHEHAAAPAAVDRDAAADGPLTPRFPDAMELPFTRGERVGVPIKLRPLESMRMGLRFKLPADARVGASFTLDLIQREGQRVVGGVAVAVRVVA
jgi:hypothetical protein